jgi:hypothetical protein
MNSTNSSSSIYPNVSSSDAKIVSSLLIGVGVLLLMILFFCFARRRSPKFYYTYKDVEQPDGLFNWAIAPFKVDFSLRCSS